MRRVMLLAVLTCLSFAPVSAQRSANRTVLELREFERDWLTALLKSDSNWLSRFSSGKLNVAPFSGSNFSDRGTDVARLLAGNLPADQMKVRVTGTIQLLTNDPALNRSFNFLDTFNKTDGKWRVIATSTSPGSGIATERATEALLDLERQLASASAKGDRSSVERLLAPSFVSTSIDGTLEDRERWMSLNGDPAAKVPDLRELRVHFPAGNVAIVTGIKVSAGHPSRFTHTWSVSDGRWLCVAAHESGLR